MVWGWALAVPAMDGPLRRVLGQQRADVGAGDGDAGSWVDGDVSLLRRPPLSRHPLRLGDLSERHLGGNTSIKDQRTPLIVDRP